MNEVQTLQTLFKMETIAYTNSGGERNAARVSKTL